MLLSLQCASAQMIVHDEQKEKQWRSMETGPWDFAPDWWYYMFHKNYSGAYLTWKWRGFHSKLGVDFKESKSNVNSIMPVRTAAELEQVAKMKKVEEERQKVEPLFKEAVALEADRMVDLVYGNFKDDFNRMQESISDGLIYCLRKSKGKMSYQVNHLQKRNDIICRNIEYIHTTGLQYGLENAKREKAYNEYKQSMADLVSEVSHLVGIAQRYY